MRSPILRAVDAGARPPGSDPHAVPVPLAPANGWHRRNFVLDVLIPSMFARRLGGNLSPLFPRLHGGQIGITWIGHATFLIQAPGCNVLIDPNWAGWLKVIKRLRHPGIEIHDLPNIDLVLITHAHFDHLDKRSLRAVAADQPIVVPYGVGDLVHRLGFRHVRELDHWESFAIGDLRVTLTPCHHWGARILHDNHRGFGGYLLETAGRSIFHCGDTAYFDGFREIARRHPIEIALLPIGAYDPPSGREVHMKPEEALQAFTELGARLFVPMHYGSFPLGYEPLDEPLHRLLRHAETCCLSDRIRVMTEGEPSVF